MQKRMLSSNKIRRKHEYTFFVYKMHIQWLKKISLSGAQKPEVCKPNSNLIG